MTRVLASLQPEPVWRHFEAICAIPHPSRHEEAIRRHIVGLAGRLGLQATVDAVGNVIIAKPATPGMEDRQPLCLQAHMDMVPQRRPDVAHDFLTDPIRPQVVGEVVKATGTTLGADNGIGVAMILAVLEATDLSHGPLEALLTVNEEAGMTGAKGLVPGLLESKMMLNLDGENEVELCIGCAGALDTLATFPAPEEPVPGGHAAFELAIGGLRGGHSGIDINLGRANAVMLTARLLWQAMNALPVRLATLEAGSLRNAIPREGRAVLTVPADQAEALVRQIEADAATIGREFSHADPAIHISIQPCDLPATVVEAGAASRLVRALFACPNGVMYMSPEVPGLIETSSNLGVARLDGGSASVVTLQRSAVDSRKQELASRIAAVFTLAGGTAEHANGYSGWRPNAASPLLALLTRTFREVSGREPEVTATHGGLECGIIMGAYPELDAVSLGPTIRFPHSPDEEVDIASVERFWAFLRAVLERIPRA
ncbi:MAG TPA: aminoacyl-histidine dipeptidase [Thermoanaerobaculaceae bacterium]|nr:aminoacyl-histidine dipeptidase [Thermoanaerobaculaceae bacterium]HRS17016.1 aminoacyl-histidine dipeptidase [Thermoanaerobaculaceae bacterium]